MSDIHQNLKGLGLTLPEAAKAAANYVPFVISGNLVIIAGQIPFLNGEKGHFGKLGKDMSIEDAQKAAQACALNVLAQLDAAVEGDWTRVKRCVRIGGFVNCTPEFDQMSIVLNAASDVFVGVLGENGRHARTSVGVASLPFGVAVEVEAMFELKA